MNKFLTKIIGAPLAIAMMIGVGAGVNVTKQAKEVNAAGDELAFHLEGSRVHGSETSYDAREANVDTGTASKVSKANWQITVGNNSAQLGTNAKAGNLSKTTLGNGSYSAASGIASALSSYTSTTITTTTQKYSAAICTTAMEYVKKVDLIFTGTNGGNITTAWVLSSTNGTTWEVEASKSSSITTGSSFTFTKNNEARQYAFVAHWNLTNSGGLKGFELKLYGEYPASKKVQANSITLKAGSSTIEGTYEPDAPYYIGDTLDLNASVVNYQTGDEYENGAGDIEWASNNESVATVTNGVLTFVSAGTTTITATAVDKGANDSTVSASFVLNISNAGPAHGSADNPYTVAEAKAAIDAGKNTTGVYAKGIVSKFPNNPFDSNNGNISYFISADGSTSGFQLEAYKGKNIGGADFTNANQVKVGAAVTVFGNLIKFNSTYEFAEGNKLVSYTVPFTISFNTNGGSSVASQIVLDGQKAQRPVDPTKAATLDYTYTFADWYDNSELSGEAYDFDTPVTADLVLFAKWNETPAPAKDVIGRMTTKTQLSYHYEKEGNGARDYLNKEFTGITSTSSYSDWKDKTAPSGAVYAGNSCGDHNSIQLRATKPSGLVTTTSGGKATMVKINWNANTADARTVDVYGKNTAYTSAEDLYSANTQGTKIGSIVNGTSTKLVITGDYEYIGIRSSASALYIDSIMIQWGELSYSYSNMSIRFGGSVEKGLWNRLDTESTIAGFGVMVTESKNVEDFDEFKTYIEAEMFKSSEVSTDASKDIIDYYVPVADMASKIGENASDYFWNLRWAVDSSNMNKAYSAIAYIKISSGYVLMDMATESVETLALDCMENGNCNTTTAGGSLQNILDLA